MRRPFRRKKDVDLESIEALHSASENLINARSRGTEITELVRESKLLRDRNHFAEQLAHIMGKGRHA